MTITDDTLRAGARQTNRLSDQDICAAYLYLMGRLLVLRQEHLDFRTGGFKSAGYKWNELVHREVGGVQWANPNLDIAYSEAWVAIDEATYVLLDIPTIRNRYYTVQLLNAWGETLANINERHYPGHPSGSFALCLRGAKLSLPAGVVRIDLPCRKIRLVARVELGTDPAAAITMQHAIQLRAFGQPRVAPPVAIPLFPNDRLPGVEAFDVAHAVLASEPDVNPGAGAMQTLVRATTATAAASRAERKRIDGVIDTLARRKLEDAVLEMGQFGNGWVRPRVAGNYGPDWLMRTVANLTGIWANTSAEVVYFGNGRAVPLDGADVYTMRFAADDLPSSHAHYFWSVTCVDSTAFRVVPNALQRFVLDSHSQLTTEEDGSITLYFAAQRPVDAPESNWLPTPAGKNYVLTWRSYGPDLQTREGNWFPSPLSKR